MTSGPEQEPPAELSLAGSVVDKSIEYMMGQNVPPVAIASALLGGCMALLAQTLGDEAIVGILNNAVASVRSGELRGPKAVDEASTGWEARRAALFPTAAGFSRASAAVKWCDWTDYANDRVEFRPIWAAVRPLADRTRGAGAAAEARCWSRSSAAAINPSDVRNRRGRVPFAAAAHSRTGLRRNRRRRRRAARAGGLGQRPQASASHRDGAHAQYVVMPAAWLSAKPDGLSMEQAASVGVPFITAWSALVTEGRIQAGETILIIGAAGAVGRAATQIAHWKGATVIPAIRSREAVPAGTINTLTDDIPRRACEI